MKKQFKTARLAMCLPAIFCTMAFATTVSAANPKSVKLEIENNQLTIKSNNSENGCPLFSKRGAGCIKVDKHEKTDIDFHLIGDTRCSLDAGTDWELNAVYLGGFDSDDKPELFGFDSTPQADYDKVDRDFTIIDKTSGLVKTTAKSANKLTVHDENQAKYVVWYQVEAICKRSDGKEPYTSTTDPRIKNGGN